MKHALYWGINHMSKSIELDKKVKLYILSCISSDGYSETPYFNECTNNVERLTFLQSVFYTEYGHEIKRIGEQQAMKEWISGLPSSFNIEYRNHEVLKLAIQWGSLSENANEVACDKIINNWFDFIANKTLQLFRGHRPPKED